jgi:uncharacterized phage-like protein YoqJ
MANTVCFTGHRQIPDEQYPALHALLSDTIERAILNGATVFRAGGAIGFDTLAALTVLSLRLRHPEIRLELILPCPSQTHGWSDEDRRLYEQIMEKADTYRFVSETYYRGVLQTRNRALVDGSDLCIAYMTSSQGGTAFTVREALRHGLEVINLADFT